MILPVHRCLAACLALFALGSAFADLYVDASSGNDYSGNGSSEAPIKTLQTVITKGGLTPVHRMGA